MIVLSDEYHASYTVNIHRVFPSLRRQTLEMHHHCLVAKLSGCAPLGEFDRGYFESRFLLSNQFDRECTNWNFPKDFRSAQKSKTNSEFDFRFRTRADLPAD